MSADFSTRMVARLLPREGCYVNDPSDAGGETMWGVTVAVARRYGYTGPMRDLPRGTAACIYDLRYIREPGFDRVAEVSDRIAEELFDAGVNMGQAVAAMFLQRGLNALNRRARDYPDLLVDGHVGDKTLQAMRTFFARRGADAEPVLLCAVKCLRGARYIELAEGRPEDEDFVFGWLKNRVLGL